MPRLLSPRLHRGRGAALGRVGGSQALIALAVGRSPPLHLTTAEGRADARAEVGLVSVAVAGF